MLNNELKPCPFCGGKEIRQAGYFEHDEFVHFVFCNDCGARTKPAFRSRGSGAAVRMFFEEKAAEAWNRRTE